MMKKTALSMFFVLATSIFFLSCGSNEKQNIKIGAILPLSGDNATYGVDLKQGMDLAVAEINNKTNSSKNIQIIYEDDAANPQKGVNAFNKLRTVDKVPLVIGAMFSSVSLSIAPIAEKNHIILLSPTSSAVKLTDAGDYIFRIYPSDSYDGKYIANFVRDSLKLSSAAIVYMQVSSTTAIADVFQKEFEKRGGLIVLKEGYKEGENKFQTIINKIINIKPSVVFIPGYLNESCIFLKQSKEMGLNVKFFGISTLYDPKIFQLAGNAAEGIIFTAPYFDINSENDYTANFVRNFREKFSKDPNIWAGYGYDVVKVAYLASMNGDGKPDLIKNALYKINDMPGVTGNLTFDKNGDVNKPLRVIKVISNKFVNY